MDRAETTGLGVAIAAHAALLAALSQGLGGAHLPRLHGDPIEVSFADEVGLTSAAPQLSSVPPVPSMAPELGTPDRAAPLPAEAIAPPRPDRPGLARVPEPKAATRPQQKQKSSQSGTRSANRESRFDREFVEGFGADPSTSRSTAVPAAVMSAQAAAGIASLIRRQVQPCADRMVSPGPGANRIKVTINLRLNRDGSLSAPPRAIGQSGLDGENTRYLQRVKELAISAFTSCSPLRGLPPELYAVPNGWSDFDMNYNLPGSE